MSEAMSPDSSAMSPQSVVRAFREGRIVGPRGAVPARSALLTPRSLLLFTGDSVLKLRRPVGFDGVTRATRTQRLYGSERELFVGRQIAPTAYLSDCALSWTPDGYELWPGIINGEPLVAMWRQPTERRLDQLALAGGLRIEDLRPMMAMIAAFHEGAPLQRRHEGHGAPGLIRRRWRVVVKALGAAAAADDDAPLSREALGALDAETDGWLERADRHLIHRVSEGRIRDLHLSLSLQHLYLTDPPVALGPDDRPEEFHWSDTAEDVALLAVELDALGHHEVAAGALDIYAGLTYDRTLPRVLPLFKRLVALRRAADLWQQAPQEPREDRTKTLAKARMYAELARTVTDLRGGVG